MEHFGSVFVLDLTEETRTQLQEEEAVLPPLASYWLRLWSVHSCVSEMLFMMVYAHCS